MGGQEYMAGSVAILGFAAFALARISALPPQFSRYWQIGGFAVSIIGIIWLLRAVP